MSLMDRVTAGLETLEERPARRWTKASCAWICCAHAAGWTVWRATLAT